MDAAIRLQIWSDLYEMERMYGRPATYVQMRAQQFNPQTGKYDEDDVVRIALLSLPSFEEDIGYPPATQAGGASPGLFSDFEQGDKVFLLSTRLLDSSFEARQQDHIEQDGEKYKFKRIISLMPRAGYIIHGRRVQ
jgi:hypothetical protein